MALKKKITLERYEVLTDGRVRIVEKSTIFDNDVMHSARLNERFIEVGADVSGEDPIVQDIVNGLHTPERLAEREAILDAARPAKTEPV